MADLNFRPLYGYNLFDDAVEGIGLQFHLTTDCDQRCKHCYMLNEDSYKQQLENPLKLEEIYILIDQFYNFILHYKTNGTIALTGGDPILSPYFWDVIKYINKYSTRISIIIMGNSYHINQDVANDFKKFNIQNYQISLDGLKETHDYLRKKGSFDDAIRAFKILHKADITTSVMFTVSKINYNDLLPLIKILNELKDIDIFCFDRMIPTGNAKDYKDDLFTPNEYRNILLDIYKYEVLNPPRLYIYKKDNLWKLLLNDLGLTNPVDDTIKKIHTGCFAGTASISILADGTAYACRRMGIKIGKFPEENFKNIFIHNNLVESIRSINKYEGCKDCNLISYCRGCLAMKYAVSGNIYAKDPNCWRCNSNV